MVSLIQYDIISYHKRRAWNHAAVDIGFLDIDVDATATSQAREVAAQDGTTLTPSANHDAGLGDTSGSSADSNPADPPGDPPGPHLPCPPPFLSGNAARKV